jgi:para-nitrobenzyl esterase
MEKTKIIKTSFGRIRGYKDGDLEIFKGIPYAERPIGELRFKPPVPRKKWASVYDALNYSPICAQNIVPGIILPPIAQSEADSLTINIWTHGSDDKKRPVMVRIHGGGFTTGSGTLPDGFKLARRDDIVVASINYRLNALGFSELPGIESNIGMLDQIEALKWINKNIHHFGGDPKNITIFGISAGGMSVSTLMAMPRAKGLFKRVIAQSGALNPVSYKIEKGKDITSKMVDLLNVKVDDLKSLRSISAYELVKAYTKVANDAQEQEIPWVTFIPPYIDGKSIPEHPLRMIKQGVASDIDLMLGSTLNESKLWRLLYPTKRIQNKEEAKDKIIKAVKLLGFDEQEGLKLFEAYKNAGDGEDVYVAFFTDLEFRISAIRLAEEQSKHNPNTYMYLFTYPLSVQGQDVGALHGGDAGFMFGMLDYPNIIGQRDSSEASRILSEKMMDCWISFAKNGDPNHKDIPEWPKYNLNNRPTMLLGKEIRSENDPFSKERVAWNKIMQV